MLNSNQKWLLVTERFQKFLEMTWPEVKQVAEGEPLVVVPVRQVVQHGPHLPIGTGVYQAEGVSAALVDQLKRQGCNAFVGPTITSAIHRHMKAFRAM